MHHNICIILTYIRGNHIETLEVLQDITNENIELKRQLSRLKLKLSKLSNNNDEGI